MGQGINRCTTPFVVFVVCLMATVFLDRQSCLAQATAPVPGQIPNVFTTTQTLNKLRNGLCSCSPHGRNRQCREYGAKDLCFLLCGCSNYGKKCLAEGNCACPLMAEEGCRGSQTLCVFDDAFICSTPNDICLYYDERKLHCDCRDGWTGDNCQTCSEGSTGCKVDDKSLDPPVAGSDLTIKVLVIACTSCLILGVLLGVFCMCRAGKLVCITTSRVETPVEGKDQCEEQNPNPPVIARQHSDHAYCHIIQYAVPETTASQPTSDTLHNAGYAEPNVKHREAESNYYYKLESPPSCATYESVKPKKGRRVVSPPHQVKDEPSSIDVMGQNVDKKSGNREFQGNPRASDEYDHLKRQVDVNISDTSKNYSHLALNEFL